MNDGVEEAGAADVAAASCVVSEPVCPLRDVKEADVGSDRLAVLADLFITEDFIKARTVVGNKNFDLKAAVFLYRIGIHFFCGPRFPIFDD